MFDVGTKKESDDVSYPSPVVSIRLFFAICSTNERSSIAFSSFTCPYREFEREALSLFIILYILRSGILTISFFYSLWLTEDTSGVSLDLVEVNLSITTSNGAISSAEMMFYDCNLL